MKPLARPQRLILNGILTLAVSVTLIGGLALTASAQTTSGGGSNPVAPPDYGLTATAQSAGLPTGNVNLIKLVATFVNIILSFLGIILVILIIYGGFLWMTSAGDEQKITKAKKILGNAIVGLVIILISYAIASFTIDTLIKGTGATTTTQTCPGYCTSSLGCADAYPNPYDCSGSTPVCCRNSGT